MDPNNWVKDVLIPFMDNLTAQYPDIPALTPHELRHTRATLWWQERRGFIITWNGRRMEQSKNAA